MSQSKNLYEAERWLKTAKDDLDDARILLENKKYASACFHAQQAGEKAVKALWYMNDKEPWGHSILNLLSGYPGLIQRESQEELIHHGAELDRFYIPTRYPNGLPDATPQENYFLGDAEKAISLAKEFVDAAEHAIG